MTPRRYPLEPLEKALGITPNRPGQRRHPNHTNHDDPLTGDQLLAQRTGFTERTIRSWRAHGLNPKAAHATAILAGRTRGVHYPLHVEIAEELDPACGPDDGGATRAANRHRQTLAAQNGAT